MKLFLLLLISSVLFSQTKEITKAEKELKQINAKINKISQILDDLKEKQSSEENSLKKLDLKIFRGNKKYRATKKALSLTKRKIKYNTSKKISLEKEISKLKVAFEKRVVSSYKLPKQSSIDILLSSKSVEEFFRMIEYNKRIHAEEKLIFKRLKKAIASRKQIIKTLEKQKTEVQKLLANQKVVLDRLKEDESDKKQYIAANKKDQKKYKKSLFKTVDHRKNLENIMTTLFANLKRKKAEKSKSGLANISDYKPLHTKFSKNKGRYKWPVEGKIITPFGKNKVNIKGSKNVYIRNTGIDIKAKKSSSVKSIHNGRITLIDYIPGFGHTIIIDHGDGYFTSYANLNDIFVSLNDKVSSGAIIGTVGSSGTINGIMKLHFELWAKNKPQNPKKWLK